MNILLIGNKANCRDYSKILSAAPNTTVLGAVTQLNDKIIDTLRSKYNPHIILFDSDVPHKKIDVSIAAANIHSKFPQAKLIIICEPYEVNIFKSICYAVISDTITNVQLLDVLNNAANNYGTESVYAEQITPIKETYQNQKRYINTNRKFKKNYLFFVGAVVIIALIIIAVIVNTIKDSPITSTPDEATSYSSTISTETTETSTTSEVVSDTTPTYKEIKTLEYSVAKGTTIGSTTATTVVHKKPVNMGTSQVATKPKNTTNNNGAGRITEKTNPTTTKSNPQSLSTPAASQSNGGSVSYNDNNYQNTNQKSVKIKLSYFTKTLAVKDSVTISAIITPDIAKNKKIKWSSSDKNIATVKQTGYVKARSVGTAIITATVGGATATCTIKVVNRSEQ